MYWNECGQGYFLNPEPETKEETRIWRQFRAFDKENPHIWKEFQRYALEAVERGHLRIGSDFICGLIRWESVFEYSNEVYKLNNNFPAYYSRKFLKHYPQHRKLFELRKLRALD